MNTILGENETIFFETVGYLITNKRLVNDTKTILMRDIEGVSVDVADWGQCGEKKKRTFWDWLTFPFDFLWCSLVDFIINLFYKPSMSWRVLIRVNGEKIVAYELFPGVEDSKEYLDSKDTAQKIAEAISNALVACSK